MKKNRLRAIALASQMRFVVSAAVWLSLFAYAGRPLLVTAAALGLAPAIAWSTLLAAALLPLLPLVYRRSEGNHSVAHWIGYVTLGVFTTLLFLVLVSDVLRGAYSLARWAISAQSWPMLDPRAVALTILGTAAVLSLVGLLQARCPRTKHVTVAIDDLPPELEGYRIVQWSDVHVGHTIQRPFVESLVAKTNALDADAVAITGDFVDGSLSELREHVAPLRDLRARDGVFYVTGNHEYYWSADEWCTALEEHGLTFLKNEHRVVIRGNARLVIAGVTDPVGRNTHKQDPDRALAATPADSVKILLSHRPQTATAADRLGVHLQLSGHTHGGQFFPFNLVIKKFQPIVAGLHRVGRTWLYVNRGTGYWGPPSRLGVQGEMTVVELRKAR